MFTVGHNTQGNVMNSAEFRRWTCDKWTWNLSLWDGGTLLRESTYRSFSEIYSLAPDRGAVSPMHCWAETEKHPPRRQGEYICGGCWCCQAGKTSRFILSAGDMRLFCNLLYSVPGNICRNPYLVFSFLLQGLRFSLRRHCTLVP